MRPIEWVLVSALAASIALVAWAAATLGDDDKPRRPLPFPKGGKPYTGLHSEDDKTRRLNWPPVGPARREAGTGPSTTGLTHWVLPPEPRVYDADVRPVREATDESGELIVIRYPAPGSPAWNNHTPPAGWNEDAR